MNRIKVSAVLVTDITSVWNAVSLVSVFVNTQVPTMIVYGEKDGHAPVNTLKQMPNSEVFMMKNAGHPCYRDDPDEWHRLLYNFLQSSQVLDG